MNDDMNSIIMSTHFRYHRKKKWRLSYFIINLFLLLLVSDNNYILNIVKIFF